MVAPGRALFRFLVDLLAMEAAILRPGGPCPAATCFRLDGALGEDGLDFDSLERLAMAAALGEALLLHRGGLDDTLVMSARLGDWHDAAMAALERFSACIHFRSSGSSGARRAYLHTLTDLEAEAAFFASLLLRR